jgi:hypothetical protein
MQDEYTVIEPREFADLYSCDSFHDVIRGSMSPRLDPALVDVDFGPAPGAEAFYADSALRVSTGTHSDARRLPTDADKAHRLHVR